MIRRPPRSTLFPYTTALPICQLTHPLVVKMHEIAPDHKVAAESIGDRKSTRLNSSHSQISYAVFCLKKKKEKKTNIMPSTQRENPKILTTTDTNNLQSGAKTC